VGNQVHINGVVDAAPFRVVVDFVGIDRNGDHSTNGGSEGFEVGER